MARTVNYAYRAEKIKQQIDELVREIGNKKAAISASNDKIKVSDINFDELDLVTLIQLQARISRLILERSK